MNFKQSVWDLGFLEQAATLNGPTPVSSSDLDQHSPRLHAPGDSASSSSVFVILVRCEAGFVSTHTCTYIYTYIHTSIHAYMCACMHVCMYLVCMHRWMYVLRHASLLPCVYICRLVCVHVCMCVHICVYMYAGICLSCM